MKCFRFAWHRSAAPLTARFGRLAVGMLALAVLTTAPSARAQNAFPGAVGFGSETFGGLPNGVESTTVIKVTNLDASGPGSLKAALDATGRRVIVFEVGGVIDLGGPDGEGTLSIANPDVTIAGHTAPGMGVTLIGGGLRVDTHDVVIQHLKVRPGDAGEAPRSGWESDSISTGLSAWNVVVDHCSGTWATDENMSVGSYQNADPAVSHDVTFSNCLVAEGLSDSTHSKGEHSKGMLLMDGTYNVSHIGNLLAHNRDRNPMVSAAEGVLVNNLVYNFDKGRVIFSRNGGHPYTQYVQASEVTAVGNVALAGPNSDPSNAYLYGWDSATDEPAGEKATTAYLEDNVATEVDGSAMAMATGSYELVSEKLAWPTGLTAMSSSQTEQYVLANAGAMPWNRDPVDQRIVQSVIHRTGGIIDSQDEVGGYPVYDPTYHSLSVPSDQSQLADWLAGFAQTVPMPTTPEKIYTEQFTLDQHSAYSAVGWQVYLAEDTGGVVELTDLGDKPAYIAGEDPDYAFIAPRTHDSYDDADGPGLMFTTEPGSVDIAELAELYTNIRLDGSETDPASARFAIRLDGQWYAAASDFTNDTNLGAGQPLDIYVLNDIDFTNGDNWRGLTVALGEGTGELTLADGVVGGVLTGAIDAFGIYAEPGNDGDHSRIDNYSVSIVPEPGTSAVAAVGCLALIRRRRRRATR